MPWVGETLRSLAQAQAHTAYVCPGPPRAPPDSMKQPMLHFLPHGSPRIWACFQPHWDPHLSQLGLLTFSINLFLEAADPPRGFPAWKLYNTSLEADPILGPVTIYCVYSKMALASRTIPHDFHRLMGKFPSSPSQR